MTQEIQVMDSDVKVTVDSWDTKGTLRINVWKVGELVFCINVKNAREPLTDEEMTKVKGLFHVAFIDLLKPDIKELVDDEEDDGHLSFDDGSPRIVKIAKQIYGVLLPPKT
jgi:hypothetical protein